MFTVLLLEDDQTLAKEIHNFLSNNQYQCDCVYDGSLVIKQYQLKPYDIVLLDVNVPGINGFEVCKNIRSIDAKVPILMLTAFGEIDDKVQAFDKGADDYLVKPFHFEELSLRIKSLLRRKENAQINDQITTIGDLIINHSDSNVTRKNVEISLSPNEYKLLNILATANGRVLSKAQIAEKLWDYHIESSQNTIEVYINFLRKKIDKEHSEKLIHTKVGFGYYLKVE